MWDIAWDTQRHRTPKPPSTQAIGLIVFNTPSNMTYMAMKPDTPAVFLGSMQDLTRYSYDTARALHRSMNLFEESNIEPDP